MRAWFPDLRSLALAFTGGAVHGDVLDPKAPDPKTTLPRGRPPLHAAKPIPIEGLVSFLLDPERVRAAQAGIPLVEPLLRSP